MTLQPNQHLPIERHIGISLVNSARNFVVTGPPMSLYGLNLQLRKLKAPTGLDQTRVPYTERKSRFVNRFLPITAPFHSPYLAEAIQHLESDLKDVVIRADDLGIPVFDTNSGDDVREKHEKNVVPSLIIMQTIETVEQEVERLLEADEMADEVKYGMCADPGGSGPVFSRANRCPGECQPRPLRLRIYRS